MSADRPDPEPFVDDSIDGWYDPYDILPGGFRDRYSHADSVSDALAMAENDSSDTDADEFERCPSCLSVRLRTKPSDREIPHKVDASKKCTACGEHFDTALPSLADARRIAEHASDTDREKERPRCRECLSTSLYPVPERSAAVSERWVCRDCTARFDDALPSYNAVTRGEATRAEREQIGAVLNDSDACDEWPSLIERASERAESYGPSEQATLREVTR